MSSLSSLSFRGAILGKRCLNRLIDLFVARGWFVEGELSTVLVEFAGELPQVSLRLAEANSALTRWRMAIGLERKVFST